MEIIYKAAPLRPITPPPSPPFSMMQDGTPVKWYEMTAQTYESTEKCLQTNYHGTKRMCEALIPFLQLSDSPRIVNVSSSWGKLKVE